MRRRAAKIDKLVSVLALEQQALGAHEIVKERRFDFRIAPANIVPAEVVAQDDDPKRDIVDQSLQRRYRCRLMAIID